MPIISKIYATNFQQIMFIVLLDVYTNVSVSNSFVFI